MRMKPGNLALSSLAGALALVAGCGAEAPVVSPPAPKHPIVGIYDLDATLRSYTTTYPTVVVSPAGSTTLAGTITVLDTLLPAGLDTVRLAASANVVLNRQSTPGAVATDATLLVTGDTMGVRVSFFQPANGLALSGKFAGDSIVGDLVYTTAFGRAQEYYLGSYVLRRRR